MSNHATITQDPRHVLGEDENGRLQAQVKYTVLARTATDAKFVNGMPRRGWLYRDEQGNIRNGILIANGFATTALSPPRPNKNGLFEVTVTYGQPTFGGTETEPQVGDGPIDYWSLGSSVEPSDFDVNGDALVDGLGNAFDPVPIHVTTLRLTSRIVVEQFDPTPYINLLINDTGRNPVNDTPFRGSDEGTALWLGFQNNPRNDGTTELAFDFDFKTNADITTLLDHDGALKLLFTMQPRGDFSALPVFGPPSESVLLNL